ncbi:yqkD [Symbiodinium natans]|uniref:YqkD protein n=1 Tax=Symbiodinium natans TaxID=878477 RepID=A0A812IMS2_9DINO|nr:yqkD [Symbiodinium natans]
MDKVSWSTFLSESYDLLWKLFIRPPRSEYLLSDLGPSKFRIQSQIYCREDFHLRNARGMRLACSLFGSYPKKPMSSTPCVIYLHGNCSSRAEALDVLQVVLAKNFRLCCMDLSGSGQSEGEFISLGCFEQFDLQVLIQHLRSAGSRLLGVWGRSMGAVTAILRAAEDPGISALVLDSPFSNLPMVAQELVQSQVGLPEFLVTLALSHVRSEIQERAHFDIQELQPIRSAPRARSPALFAVAEDDDFVLPHHTRDLHAVWGAEAKLVTFKGGHNGSRPKWYLEQAADFLAERLVDTLPTAPSPGPVFKRSPKEELAPALNLEEDPLPPPPPLSPAAVPAARADGALLTAQLMEMGFSQDVALEAARHFGPTGSTEEAMEWALESTQVAKESVQALGSLAKRLAKERPHVPLRAMRDADLSVEPLASETSYVSPQVEAASAAAGRALEKKLGNLAVLSELTGRSLRSADNDGNGYRGEQSPIVEQLLALGFPLPRAREAAARCSTVEGAVAWLTEPEA